MNIIKIDKNFVKKNLPKRFDWQNKNHFGRILIVAGSKNMSGAPYLAALSAFRSGCGIVYIAVPDLIRDVIALGLPEAIVFGLKSNKGYFDSISVKQLAQLKEKYRFDLLIIGPGIGFEKNTADFVIDSVKLLALPSVIDADGLNSFSLRKEKIKILREIPCIMTPHEGELKRLIGDKKDRKESALSLSAMSGAVVVLKGKNTLITDGVEICENTTGDNTLAKAGSGDVLSGIIGSLWVQKAKDSDYRKSAISSAAISVWIHGRCGDLAKEELTNRGLLSSEIASVYLPKVFKELV